MQQVKNSRETDRLKKEFQNVKIGFLKQNLTVRRFCEIHNIDRRHVYRVFNGTWKGKKASELKDRLITASKNKTVNC